MLHRVALSFEDGVTRFIECEDDQTVADASYRARINIPLDCRDGACGTCKAFCESGDYDGGVYLDDALTASEAARGFVLPCSMKPRTDLVLQIATTSAIAKTAAATFTATIVGLERSSVTTMTLAVTIPNRDELAFLPGQYMNIRVPGTDEARSYSFSNDPDDEVLTFLIKLTPGGVMSEYLSGRAAVGDELQLTGPSGSFFLRDAMHPLLLIAGGTGLSPMLSILRRLRRQGSTRPVHLVYGVSRDEDLVELAALEELATDLKMTWEFCVSDPATTAARVGRVTRFLAAEHLREGDVAVYLCGPPAMVEGVRQHLEGLAVVPAATYVEKYILLGAPHPELEREGDVTDEAEPEPEPDAVPAVAAPAAESAVMNLLVSAGASRSIARQPVLLERDDRAPLAATVPVDRTPARAIAGQPVFVARKVAAKPAPVEAPSAPHGARAIAGQLVFAAAEAAPAVAPAAAETKTPATKSPAPAPTSTFLSPGRFAGKVVLLTGGAQGIGERAARRISAEGGILVLADRSEFVHEVAESLTATGQTSLGVVADLEGWEGAHAAVERAIAEFGRIDVAIHTVGGTIWQKPFQEYEPEQVIAEISRSLYPTLWGCRAVAPHMIAAGGGTIINVSSTATRGIHRVPYSAAKGGINAITASLALELAPYGIRVAATAPGGTDAPPRRVQRGPLPESPDELAWRDQTIAQVVDSTLVKRYGSLDEQAAAIAFLASDEASYITGTTLPVAGGDLG
jgi:NAD(P)-dependent dehydrogenase (short-subunit alcohol dehydrogenase family)/NAD(P)H-flavin reductase/ferredoxin